MSPPGKNSGVTTYASVVNASRTPPMATTAWSSRLSRISLRNAGRKQRASSSAVIFPPLPCPSRMRSPSLSGRGQLENVIFAEGHVDQIPHDVIERDVRLLDAMDAERRYDEHVLGHAGEPAAVLAGERDRQHTELARDLHAVHQVRRLPAGSERQRHVAGAAEQAELVAEDLREIAVVRDR